MAIKKTNAIPIFHYKIYITIETSFPSRDEFVMRKNEKIFAQVVYVLLWTLIMFANR